MFLYVLQNKQIKKNCFRELEPATLNPCQIHGTPLLSVKNILNETGQNVLKDEQVNELFNEKHPWQKCPEVTKAIDGVIFIAAHTKREEDSTRVSI